MIGFSGVKMVYIDLLSIITWRITKWTSVREEFTNSKIDGILHNCEACLLCSVSRVMKVEVWFPLRKVLLKFNVDGGLEESQGQRVLRVCLGTTNGVFCLYSIRM